MEERIVAVAFLFENGLVVSKGDGARHSDLIRQLARHGFDLPIRPEKQGFMTSTARFVDREEALLIARAAGQIIRETAPQNGLFSEDVW